MSNATTERVRTVPVHQLIERLEELSDRDFLTVQKPLAVLHAHPVDPDSLVPYIFWDSQHYTRNLIHKTELYELLAICWDVGMKSSIHNHKNQNCWMSAPVGKLEVHNYKVLEENLGTQYCNIVPTDVVEITPGTPVAVDPLNPVHDVRNPREWNQRAVSLHLYSRPFDSCVVYSCEQHTCGEIGLCYTSMHGKIVKTGGDPGPD
jgi:cysteine dioxygenase